MNYEFLIEERNTAVSIPGVSFSVWGRSAQALLDKPYANPLLSDLEEKVHPWQNGDVTATQIIQYAINYCCSSYIKSKVVVHWNVDDFVVYKDSFSTSNSSPMDIISQLVSVVGAEVIANADGSLTVQEYSVGTLDPVTKLTEDISIQEYNDLDHIISLNDDVVYPIGYNSVVVNGYGSSSTGGDGANTIYLSAELQEDDLKGWEYGRSRKVKVYNYHPKNLGVATEVLGHGYSSLDGANGIEDRTETVLLTWGDGNTQYPNTNGLTQVKGDEDIPLAYKTVSYRCYCATGYIRSYITKNDVLKEGIAAFYFSDRTGMATIGFDYYEIPLESDSYEVQLELNETELDADQFYIKGIVLGYDYSNIKRIYTTTGTYVSQYGNVGTKRFIEDVSFTNGTGQLAHPFCQCRTYSFYDNSGYILSFKKNRTEVVISNYDSTAHPLSSLAAIDYESLSGELYAPIPWSFVGKSFSIYLDTNSGSTMSISKTVNNTDIPIEVDKKDISILVKDFATDVIIPNADVVVDGISRGSTDADGIITIIGISVGDHTIKITASNYLDSDEDELANDTFTVS
jgi:hypothetical protein